MERPPYSAHRRSSRHTTLLSLALAAASAAASAVAQSPAPIGPFTRPTSGPVLSPDPAARFTDPITHQPVAWEALHAFNPAAIVRHGTLYVLYRAEDTSGSMQIGMHTSRLGLATSTDGLHFTREPQPVFFPADDAQKSREWPGGVEDPRLVEAPDGTYVLTYTQWNRQTYSIGIATSPDLVHWTKHGPAFLGSASGRYDHLQYKSGGILTTVVHTPGQPDRPVAARLHDNFLMYWGEIVVHLATSPDLVHWTPVEDPATHQPVAVLSKRPGHFDSGFPEVGPPPLLRGNRIIALYNGKNSPTDGDPALGANAYATGEAIFDADNPAHLLSRTEHPVLQPTAAWEKTGQYAAGTTFAEGLVLFPVQGKLGWLLVYGAADSLVGVATAPYTP